MNKAISFEEVTRAIAEDSNSGFCTSCGNEQYGCEPDAREYECEVCGKKTVYGAEEILIMGEFGISEIKEYEALTEFASSDIKEIALEMAQIIEDCKKERKPQTWAVLYQLDWNENKGYFLRGTIVSDKVHKAMNQFLKAIREMGKDEPATKI